MVQGDRKIETKNRIHLILSVMVSLDSARPGSVALASALAIEDKKVVSMRRH